MSIITKEIEIKLNGANIQHYKNLGYEIPKKLNKYNKEVTDFSKLITVRVEDLPPTSKTIIKVQCDCCGKLYNQDYGTYKHNEHNGKSYCHYCAIQTFCTGENAHQWKDDISDEERQIKRSYPEYKLFIKKVLKRDKYICQCCGKHYDYMEVHHLEGYDSCIEKRTDETNGITLCKNCHKNFHVIYGKGNNTKEQFEEWLGYAIGNLDKYNGELPTAKEIYCFEDNKIYKNAGEFAEKYNLCKNAVYNVCRKETKRVRGKRVLYLNDYQNMSSDEIKEYLEWSNVN